MKHEVYSAFPCISFRNIISRTLKNVRVLISCKLSACALSVLSSIFGPRKHSLRVAVPTPRRKKREEGTSTKTWHLSCSVTLELLHENVLLYIGVTISILIGYKHAANSCWLCFRYVIPTDNSFYTCRSDVVPTDNSFMHAEVTSPNTLNSSLSNFVMAESTSRFATLSAENLYLLLLDKDVLKVFHQYLKEKKADEPQTKETLANVLKLPFYAEVRKVDGTSYSKSTLNIC